MPRSRNSNRAVLTWNSRRRKSWRRRRRSAKAAGLTLQVAAKAGVDGRLFGSVTNFDLSEALATQGFKVEKALIRMPQGPLKQVGEHKVAVALHTDVVSRSPCPCLVKRLSRRSLLFYPRARAVRPSR